MEVALLPGNGGGLHCLAAESSKALESPRDPRASSVFPVKLDTTLGSTRAGSVRFETGSLMTGYS